MIKNNEDDLLGKIAIPFVKNFDGDSPFHLCFKANNLQAMDQLL